MKIAIDGPAGAGKSTVSKELARRLGYQYIDTGGMYRAFALQVLQKNIDPNDPEGLADIAKGIEISESWEDDSVRVFLNGQDVTEAIRAPEVGTIASQIATDRRVREKLVEEQRRLAEGKDVVVEGRDVGTVVFPEAEIKFFLDASPEIRAARRALELSGRGASVASGEVLREIAERDRRDRERSVSPLTRAEDAVYIDSTGKIVDKVVQEMLEFIRTWRKGENPR